MVTVVKYGILEIFSGDSHGMVTVWWTKTGKILQQCKAHTGKVTDLQFDATKIISCGMDHVIQIIDVMSGSLLLTLRGHQGSVLGISFDIHQVLSFSNEGKLRIWKLSKSTDAAQSCESNK